MASGKQGCAGRTTHHVGVGLGKTSTVGGQVIQGRCVKVLGAETVYVESALVIGEEDDDVGFIGALKG